MPSSSLLAAARACVRRGWAVIPVPAHAKSPAIAGWPNLRLTEQELPRYFNGAAGNIGVLLGAPSGWLVDMDLDCPEARTVAMQLVPPTLASGHAGNPWSHYWFCAEGARTVVFQDPEKKKLVELRSTGLMTLIPPSIHPEGHGYIWQNDQEPMVIEAPQLAALGARIAAGALLARCWPAAGGRHDAALALAGVLLRAGWSDEEARRFIAAVAAAAGDEEALKRVANVATTHRRLTEGREAWGVPTLKRALRNGANVMPLVLRWLGIGGEEGATPAPHTPEAVSRSSQRPPLSERIRAQLAALGYTFRKNLVDDTIEVNGVPLTDDVRAEIRMRMRDAGVRGMAAVEDVYTVEAARNAYHPVQARLLGLGWDGHDYIADLAAHLTSSDAPVIYADGRRVALHAVYLRRWLVGAVARALDGAQNMMLVLAGPQGIGKDHLARWLGGLLPDRFMEGPVHTDDKDCAIAQMTQFLWNVSELDATTRRADVSALKAFITRQVVTVRKPYGRSAVTRPALANFIGTVNEGSGFLADETGNRRFLVTSVQAIDWGYTAIPIEQLWAQAVALYRAGEPWQLQPEELARQTEQNRAHEAESVLDSWIRKYFDLDAGADAVLTAADIVDHLAKHDVRLHGSPRAQAMELSAVLTRLGVGKARAGGLRVYRGIAPREISALPPQLPMQGGAGPATPMSAPVSSRATSAPTARGTPPVVAPAPGPHRGRDEEVMAADEDGDAASPDPLGWMHPTARAVWVQQLARATEADRAAIRINLQRICAEHGADYGATLRALGLAPPEA